MRQRPQTGVGKNDFDKQGSGNQTSQPYSGSRYHRQQRIPARMTVSDGLFIQPFGPGGKNKGLLENGDHRVAGEKVIGSHMTQGQSRNRKDQMPKNIGKKGDPLKPRVRAKRSGKGEQFQRNPK